MVVFPELVGEIAKRGIKKREIAQSIHVCDRAFSNKLHGRVPFTWTEVCSIRAQFFPDMSADVLFRRSNGA